MFIIKIYRRTIHQSHWCAIDIYLLIQKLLDFNKSPTRNRFLVLWIKVRVISSFQLEIHPITRFPTTWFHLDNSSTTRSNQRNPTQSADRLIISCCCCSLCQNLLLLDLSLAPLQVRIIQTFLISMTLVTALIRIPPGLAAAFVQWHQKVGASITVSNWYSGLSHGLSVLLRHRLSMRVCVVSSHLNQLRIQVLVV